MSSGVLDGCTVALGGKFPGQTQAQLSAYLKSIGAAVTSSVTKVTTHVITTDADYTTNAKVRTGQQQGCHIVSLEWANTSDTDGVRADEADFAVGTVDGKATSNGKSNGTSIGAAAQSEDDDQDGSTTTSRRSGRKRAAPASKSDTAAPAPKAKKAKSAPVKIDKAADADVAGDDAADDDVADDDDDDEDGFVADDKKHTVGDAQILKSKDIVIPVDEGVSLANPSVYISPEGVIHDAALNQTNSGKNNNKFYRLQLLKSNGQFFCWTRWGRVGERGQSAMLGNGKLDDAMKNYDKKFKDKTGLKWADRAQAPKPNKYAFVERSYEPDSDNEDQEPEVKADSDDENEAELVCTLEKPVQDLLGLIFNASYLTATLSELKYDAQKLPLGKLSKATILKGFQALKDLSAVLNDATLGPSLYNKSTGDAIEDLSNLFYSLIPHAFGRNRPPVIHTGPQLKREIELLDSLSDMKAAADIMKLDKDRAEKHPLDAKFEALGMEEMTVLDHKGKEFKQLEAYLQGSKGDTHHHTYKVQDIFRIERQGEARRFEQSKFAKVDKSNRRLLWHGSRSTNFGGILSQGLRIAPPEAPVNGYMFDKGVYLADMVS